MKKYENVSFRDVDLKDGFWLKRYLLNKNVSLESVKNRFEETARFDALRFNYLKNGRKPHIFYDSDVAKWIEAVAYIMEKDRDSMRENEKFIDELIDCMANAQRDDGYLNSTFQQITPDKIFRNRGKHELYCAGHLIEAAVAYDKATGKHKFLEVMEKYCDCIYRAFIKEKTAAFVTPGHEEIELALMKLYRYTGKEKYFEMARFFLENRGKHDEQYVYQDNRYASQDDTDIYNLKEAVGHSVRALYLYSGVADLALETGDEKLFKALTSVFDDIVNSKMYVTGGVGSTFRSESFTVPYDLPNITAYSESCCAIAFILFALRMRKMDLNPKYGHLIERVMYNSLLSSTDLTGKAFFYENPLEIALEEYGREVSASPTDKERLPITQRLEVFGCSCCPPNINRFFAELGDVIAFAGNETLYIEQYVSSDVNTSLGRVEIRENYALSGKAEISSQNFSGKKLAVRLPEWSNKLVATSMGKPVKYEVKEGYAYFDAEKSFSLQLDFGIKAAFVAANPKVRADAGRIALTYGPVVYCLEGVDNGERLNRISVSPEAAENAKKEKDFHGLYSVKLEGFIDKAESALYFPACDSDREKKSLKFIPYFAFANRGESDMLVWVRKA